MWYASPIDILSHYGILSQDWKVLHDVIINYMEDSLYRLTINVLELPCKVIPFYIVGGVVGNLLGKYVQGRPLPMFPLTRSTAAGVL